MYISYAFHVRTALQEEKNSVSCSSARMRLCLEALYQDGGASPVAAQKLAKVREAAHLPKFAEIYGIGV